MTSAKTARERPLKRKADLPSSGRSIFPKFQTVDLVTGLRPMSVFATRPHRLKSVPPLWFYKENERRTRTNPAGHGPRETLEALGAVSHGTRLGKSARRLQCLWDFLGLLHARSRTVTRVPLDGRWNRRYLR